MPTPATSSSTNTLPQLPPAEVLSAPLFTRLKLGAELTAVETSVGPCSPRHQRDADLSCYYLDKGVRVDLRNERVERIVLFRAGRTPQEPGAPQGTYGAFRPRLGNRARAFRVGDAAETARGALGAPTQQLLAVGELSNADGSTRDEVWEYALSGVALVLDRQPNGRTVVGAVHIPLAEAKPKTPPRLPR